MKEERIKDVSGEIERICKVLDSRYPEGAFELFLRTKGATEVWHETGPIATVKPHMLQFCREFPGAALHFDPTHPYGIVSVVTCDCSEVEGGCAEKCAGPKEHPRAYLRLKSDGHRTLEIG